MAETPVLVAEDLAKSFDVSRPLLQRLLAGEGRRTLKAVDGVSFDIPKGTTLSLVGESGCGKSTVARLVVGLYRPTQGRVLFEGIELEKARANPETRRRMQMIFQDPYASLNPRWRVQEIVAEPIRAFGLAQGAAALRDRVGQLLTQVGLSPLDGEKFPHEFSGGQRQRISIARALSSNPDFLVCDEPTSALDVSVQAQILNLMKDLQARLGLTYLFISHNLAVVRQVSDRIGVMYLGRLVELAPAETLFTAPRHPYTRALMEAIPDLEMTGRQRIPVGGEVPSPINPPTGCPFHPRCPLADARCKAEMPKLLPPPGQPGTIAACHAVEEGRDPAPAPAGTDQRIGTTATAL
ncbi:ABC transporter ATP-binding protein [Paracraurococcus ruber]|uniref:ABC transporter ATP-binding protein n=1 Tax=Paracraurococcus ruber TaxID=77675 RepID=A0ABS1CW45_9PROT|nr:oligopeptide/dipeptide ABC transporter ATP-binding protein [Paracraurococcus ruber]MBK1658172.1 ABC transporter ATP-binding protein [Paracraurococcus ruber]TDG31801.1 ATP-binding cassette domain-containing protein [Paracraurococcus ruber]